MRPDYTWESSLSVAPLTGTRRPRQCGTRGSKQLCFAVSTESIYQKSPYVIVSITPVLQVHLSGCQPVGMFLLTSKRCAIERILSYCSRSTQYWLQSSTTCGLRGVRRTIAEELDNSSILMDFVLSVGRFHLQTPREVAWSV